MALSRPLKNRPLIFWSVLSLLHLIPALSPGQAPSLHFDRLTTQDGLSVNTITRILHDRRGYAWIGTQDGLNRYDGRSIVTYRPEAGDSASLADSYVTALGEDGNGDLWVGSDGGTIDRFNRASGTFTRFGRLLADDGSLDAPLSSILPSPDGRLLVGTIGRGLFLLDPRSGTRKQYRHSPSDSTSLSQDNVWAVHRDRTGRVWVATYDGLNRFDEESETFSPLRLYPRSAAGDQNIFNAIAEDSAGRLWIAVWRKGIGIFDPRTGKFSPWSPPAGPDLPILDPKIWSLAFDRQGKLWISTFDAGLYCFDGKRLSQSVREPDDPMSLAANDVMTLAVDGRGRVWAGTNGGGVNAVTGPHRGFRLFRRSSAVPNSLSGSNVWTILEDRKGNLWIGMLDGGLNRVDAATGRVTRYLQADPGTHSTGGTRVTALLEDRRGRIWVGTQFAGLLRFQQEGGEPVRFFWRAQERASLSSPLISSLFEARDGGIWIGTSGGGLTRLDPETGVSTWFRNKPKDPSTVGDEVIITMRESGRGGFWIGTKGGLSRYDGRTFTTLRNDPANPNSLSNDRVFSLYEDSTGILWIGTWGGGLNRYDPDRGTFTRYGMKEGLPNSTVYGILPDGSGRLWLSTNKGLVRFDPAGGVKCYDVRDGLQGDEFNQGASWRMRSGELLFGGVNGLTRFHPDSIRDDLHPPRAVITGFATADGSLRLRDEISSLKEVRLSYDQNFFSFTLASPGTMNPSETRFAYRLQGLDQEWVDGGSGGVANYTAVPPGTYRFQTSAVNRDGAWNREGDSVTVTIVPPPWRSWWATLLYLLAAAGGVAGIVANRSRKHARALAAHRLTIEEGERQLSRERSVSEALRRAEEDLTTSLKEKEALLKEVHHRVKNNLQVISSLLRLQSNQFEDEHVRSVFQESQDRVRTMALIHEKLYRSPSLSLVDFNAYIHDLASRLTQAYATVPVEVRIAAENVFLPVDIAVPCGLIINELFTNSLKHGFSGGGEKGGNQRIDISMVSEADGTTVLSVIDNGAGIPPHLNAREPESLGLQIVAGLTEQLDGTFTLEGGAGTVARVVFTLPMEERGSGEAAASGSKAPA